MEKKEFIKQVTSLFASENFDEVNKFLTENKAETIGNKKFIQTLNENMGNDTVTKTVATIVSEQKEEKKNLQKTLISASKNDDEALLFNTLKPFDINAQFNLIHHFYSNKNLLGKFLTNMIDKFDELSKENKDFVKHECVESYQLDVVESLGEYYCNKTGDIKDKVDLLKQKAHLISTLENKTIEEKELAVTNSFNALEEYKKKDAQTNHLSYFSYCPEQLVFLSKDKISKVCEFAGINTTNIITSLLHGGHNEHLNYYLNKLDSEIKIPFRTYLYVLENNGDTTKLTIDPNSEFKVIDEDRVSSTFHSLFRKEGLFSKFIHDEKVKEFLNKKNNPLSLPDQAFNLIMSYTSKDDVDYLFNKTKFFNLNDNQKAESRYFLNNHEAYVINLLNKGGRSDAANDFVNENINNESFLAKLTGQAKEKILLDLDYSKVKDTEAFIKDFLSQLPVTQYSCYHSRILHDVPKDKTAITKYLLNEKTDLDRVHIYEALHFFHLLTDNNKNKFVKQLVDDKLCRYDYESLKENARFHKEEKKNLEEMNSLVEVELANSKSKKPKKK